MLHSFTRNHDDLSTEAGFQFEFFCDCCGNGYKSSFVQSSTYGHRQKTERFGRMASSLGGLLGGRAGDLGSMLERGSDMLGGRFNDQSPEWRKEHERAFDAAQREVRPNFKKCPSCNTWVCADCWNDEEGLCVECAPREASYVAQARNRAMRRNIDEAADTATVWQGKLEKRTTVCPKCGKPAGEGKFCNNCGAPLGTQRCPNCGAQVALGLKFCGECGSPMKKSGKCPSCGHENEPGMKFCGECGTKL
ncbi:MAG: zinc ribbon domain-containing protein [Clostridia bacterium]|nr:zinc ribbon domain-containing protein [Clostridia bacterium]